MNTDGTGFAVLRTFTGSDGQYAYGGLAFADGVLYGTTYLGGSFNEGVVFSLNLSTAITITKAANALKCSWNSVTGMTYQLQCKTNLGQANWSNLGDPIMATNTISATTDATGGDPQRFYRLLLQ